MRNKSEIIGLISIKGGVGKTSCTINLGASLAHEFNNKILMIDGNYSAPNLGLHLGLVKPEITLNDVFKRGLPLSSAIHKYNDNLDIIPCSLIGKELNLFSLKKKIREIKNDYDKILIDSSPNLNKEMLSTIVASDKLLVVTTPDYPTLSTTMYAVKVADDKKTPISGLILNKVRNKKFELDINDIETSSNKPVLAVLPDDVRVLESLSLTKPMIHHKRKSEVSIEYNKLAAYLLGTSYKDPRIFSKLKNFFR